MESANFPDFQKKTFEALIAATKSARALTAEDVTFNRSLDSQFGAALDITNAKILVLVNKLVKNASEGSELQVEKHEDADSLETGWPVIADVVDFLLEKADICLDEYTGMIKKGNLDTTKPTKTLTKSPLEFRKLLNKTLHMPKPQASFKRKIDPISDEPFQPYLLSKPHAILSLEDSLKPQSINGRDRYPHPYEGEIQKLKYPPQVFEASEPIPFHPFNETTAIWVETPEALTLMLADLKKQKEIAIDLEHHDNRSYIGVVCLMQISTRNQDYIVDTMALRDELSILNEVTCDPSIIKVLHGAFMDIIWLQRDLGIYVVGLFDTYDACRELGFSGASLAFLLKKYIDFDADKRYQLADWRVRPLPQEMLDYARSDTHFLLYIYDNVRNELLAAPSRILDPAVSNEPFGTRLSAIQTALEASRKTSLKLFEMEPYDFETGKGNAGWANIMKHNPTNFTSEQFAVFRAVHQWRDRMAREEDESVNYVMGKHHIFNLARQAPKDTAGVFVAVTPSSPVVKRRAGELLDAIRKAKENIIPLEEIETFQNVTREFYKPSNNGVAVVLAKERDKQEKEKEKKEEAVYDSKGLQTPTSKFWADTYGGSRWQMRDLITNMADVSLALPLPRLSAAVFEDPSLVKREAEETKRSKEHEYVKAADRPLREESNDIIIVKQLGGSRKRKIDIINDRPSADDTPVATDSDAPEEETKEQRKKRRKEEKTAKKAAKAAQDIDGVEAGEKEKEKVIFDYKTAPSILHGKKNTEQKGFDPYNKGDGPKKARGGRKDKEREGRSFTFKNRGQTDK